MNIAFVTNVVYPFVTGGAEKRVHEIGARLVDLGHDVTVYGRHYWDGPSQIEYEGMTLQAVSPERDLYSNGRRSIPEALEFSKDLMRPLRAHVHEHDVVVASVFPYFPVLTARAVLVRTDIPLVTTWHEVWGAYWDEYLGLLAPLGKAVEHVTARVPQYPVAVSNLTADRLAEIGPDRKEISVVPNGIDTARIRSISPADQGFDVLFAGRLIADKHVDRLLDAFDQTATEHDVTLGVIGDGPQRAALERKAQRRGARDRITFLGFLADHEDVLAHMKAASVFVSPSTREGFGITYLEAMAADCIVIGTDHPDSAAREVIDGGGYIVDSTVDALAETLDRALSGERSPNNPMEVATEYDWDAIAKQAVEVYRDSIEG